MRNQKLEVVRPSFWRPYIKSTDAPTDAPTITWNGRKKVVVVFVALCAAAYLYSVTTASVSVLLNVSLPSPKLSEAWEDIARVAAAAGVLLGLLYIGGLWGEFDAFSAPQRFKHGLGYYLRFCVGTGVVTFALLVVAMAYFPSLHDVQGTDGVPPGYLHGLLIAALSAVTEEIVATVFIYWVLERVRVASGKTLAATYWGVCAIVAVHAMYHVAHEMMLLNMVLPLVFTALCWRYTRSLLALIVGHFTWDAIAMIPAPLPVVVSLFSLTAVIGYFALDSQPVAKQ